MGNAGSRWVEIDVVLARERLDLRILRQIFGRSILDVVIDGETGCAGSAIDVAPICLNFGITAPVLSCVITWRGRIETKSPLRTCVPGASPSA
jgi:hypothetical protein